MRGDALAAMEHFDGRHGEACVDGLVDQRVGHRVGVLLDGNVVVDVGLGAPLLGVLLRFGRQRPQRGAVEPLEEVAPAGAIVVPHRLGVEEREELRDALVERGQPEEGLVAEPGANMMAQMQRSISKLEGNN